LTHDRDGVIELRVVWRRRVVGEGEFWLSWVSIGKSSPVVHDGVRRVPWDLVVVMHDLLVFDVIYLYL
jgi:hypothetical protein